MNLALELLLIFWLVQTFFTIAFLCIDPSIYYSKKIFTFFLLVPILPVLWLIYLKIKEI